MAPSAAEGSAATRSDGANGEAPAASAGGDADPGRVTLHRLNRAEYANTMRDLLGTTLRPADDFPPDDRGYGFDNIADVLSLSPVQLEMYFNAAQALVDEAMSEEQPNLRRFEAERMTATVGAVYKDRAWNLNSTGSLQQSVQIASAGEYRIAVGAFQQQAGPEPARMRLDIDGATIHEVAVDALEAAPAVYEVRVQVKAGSVTLGASFLNDYYVADPVADRNLIVDFIEIESPLGAVASNPLRARTLSCTPQAADPESCWRDIARRFGRRAWRRPLTDGELDRVLVVPRAARAAGDELESATRLMLRALLMSPNFIFRVETDPEPTSSTPHPLSDHELASRLSYFLWSSMPDDALLDLADQGLLRDEVSLRAQARRMLGDPKARALVDNFAGQWLFLRALVDHDPDKQVFPEFDAELRSAMRAETELYLREFLFGDETLDRLLTPDFSFWNARLARHYGSIAMDPGMSRVTLPASERVGLLTQASVSMVTSYATRTSPVKRGKWVLEQLLCSPPPPPPPAVEGLSKEVVPTASLRQRTEAHRSNPVCASCHQSMDPIGFGLENYDAIGRYRTTDQGFAIDASGMLPSGQPFAGARELAQLLTGDPRFALCTVQQLLTYALGRGPEDHDKSDISKLAKAFVDGGYRFGELIELVVSSPPFRMRRGEPNGASP